MVLDDEQLKSFQTLYKERFGKEISREEAYEQGAKLIRLVELVYKPMTEEEYQKLQKHRKETSDSNSTLKNKVVPLQNKGRKKHQSGRWC